MFWVFIFILFWTFILLSIFLVICFFYFSSYYLLYFLCFYGCWAVCRSISFIQKFCSYISCFLLFICQVISSFQKLCSYISCFQLFICQSISSFQKLCSYISCFQTFICQTTSLVSGTLFLHFLFSDLHMSDHFTRFRNFVPTFLAFKPSYVRPCHSFQELCSYISCFQAFICQTMSEDYLFNYT